jgi:NTP pyrophosphatase (non-canonical NTP hydrolase)
MDDNVTIEQLRDSVRSFMQSYRWEMYPSPKNLSVNISIEAAGLMQNFQWLTDQGSQEYIQNKEYLSAVSSDLADVLVYSIILANLAELDLSTIVKNKLAQLQKK